MKEYERTLFAAAQQFAGVSNKDLGLPVIPKADPSIPPEHTWQHHIPVLVEQSWPQLDRTARLVAILGAFYAICIVDPKPPA